MKKITLVYIYAFVCAVCYFISITSAITWTTPASPSANFTDYYNKSEVYNKTEIDANNASWSSNYNSTYNTLLNQSCPVGQVVNGTLPNGTFICTTVSSGTYNLTYDATSRDVTANRTNWESTSNQTYQDYITANQSNNSANLNGHQEANLNVNSSVASNSTSWWAGVSGWVNGFFQKTGNNLDVNTTYINTNTNVNFSQDSLLHQGLTPQQVANLAPSFNQTYQDYNLSSQFWYNGTSGAVQVFTNWLTNYSSFIAYTNQTNAFFYLQQINGTAYTVNTPTNPAMTGNVLCSSPSNHHDGNGSIQQNYYRIYAYNLTVTGSKVYSQPLTYNFSDNVSCLFGSGQCWNTATCTGGCQFKSTWTAVSGASGYLWERSNDNGATFPLSLDVGATTNGCDPTTTGINFATGTISTPSIVYDQAVQGNGKYTSNGDIDIVNGFGLKFNGASALSQDSLFNTAVLLGQTPKETTGSQNTRMGWMVFPNNTIGSKNVMYGSNISRWGTGGLTNNIFVGFDLYDALRGAGGVTGNTLISGNSFNKAPTIAGITSLGQQILNNATSVDQSMLIESSNSPLLPNVATVSRIKIIGNGGAKCKTQMFDVFGMMDSFDCNIAGSVLQTAIGFGSGVFLENGTIAMGGNTSLQFFTDMYPSQSHYATIPRTFTYHSTDATGTDKVGSDVILAGGRGTGVGRGGLVRLDVADNSTTGSAQNSLYDIFVANGSRGMDIQDKNGNHVFTVFTDGSNSLGVIQDNYKFYYGASKSSSITYNGSDTVINPKEVSSGKLYVLGDEGVTGNIFTPNNVTAIVYHGMIDWINVPISVTLTGTTACTNLNNLVTGYAYTCQTCVDSSVGTQIACGTIASVIENCACKVN